MDELADSRKRAEEEPGRQSGAPLTGSGRGWERLSLREMRRLAHELRARQAELERQNEELRRTQLELEALCDRYLDLYDFAPVGYITLDEKGLILEANLTGAAMLGVERDALIGQPLSRFIAQDEREAFDLHRRWVFSASNKVAGASAEAPTLGGRQVCELRMVKANGEPFQARLESVVVEGSKGALQNRGAQWRIALSDISERVGMEEALRESEERFRIISELVSDYVYVLRVEPSGHLVHEWSTEALSRITGFSPEELSASGSWMNLPHPKNKDIVLRQRRAFLTGPAGRDSVSEYRILTKSGEVRWLRDYTRTVWDEAQGRVVRIYGAAQDITERVRAEEALRESEQRFRNAFQYAAFGMALVSPTRRFLQVNPSLCKMIGYSEQELLGMTFQELTHPDDVEPGEEIFHDLLAGKRDYAWWQKRYLHKDGHVVWVLLSTSVVRTSQGEPLYLVSQLQDISERVRAEEASRQRTAQLEVLREIGLELAAQLELETLLHLIASQAAGLLEGAGGEFHLYRPELDVLERYTVLHHKKVVIQRGEGLVGKVLESGRALTVDDYQHWEGRSPAYAGYPVVAVVGVPVRWGPASTGVEAVEFLGVLDVWRDIPLPFSRSDVELLEMLAAQAAIAIKNARLYEQAQREIAERKQVEEALRESEERYRTLIESQEEQL